MLLQNNIIYDIIKHIFYHLKKEYKMTKEDAFEDIYKLIQNKGVDIYESKTLSEQEKLDYIDATLDVMRFIKTKIKEKETQDRDDMAR